RHWYCTAGSDPGLPGSEPARTAPSQIFSFLNLSFGSPVSALFHILFSRPLKYVSESFHILFKKLASLLVAFKLIPAGTGRRQKHRVPGFPVGGAGLHRLLQVFTEQDP